MDDSLGVSKIITGSIDIAKEVISIEIESLRLVSSNLTQDFQLAVDCILMSTGRVIVCGMGKSGIIGKKIAASLASTGTPSFFMHPGEAFHGDLGMVKPEDIFIAISNSGETDEVLKIIPFLKSNNNIIIAMTKNIMSSLGSHADYHLNISVTQEACPLQLAPTSSTTAALVMGDALTVALMSSRKFTPERFARFHPGGSLGRRLLGKVKDEMLCDFNAFVDGSDSMAKVIGEITRGQAGLVVVRKSVSCALGVVTDGDVRRSIEKYGKSIFDLNAKDICSFSPVIISPDTSIEKAFDIMDDRKINALLVVVEREIVGVFKR